MMKNDTDMTCEFWHFEIENQILNFCVGKSVDWKRPLKRSFLTQKFLIWNRRSFLTIKKVILTAPDGTVIFYRDDFCH